MPIVAYASAAADPAGSQIDATIALADNPLPIAEVQLYGAGVDSSDGGALFTYAWTILQQPPGPAAALDSAAAQNPKLQALQTWGNYRLFLVVTNAVTGETSETNYLKAPNSAFVHVRLLSTNKALEKPAPGERDWHARVWEVIEAVENDVGGVGDHAINDHTDAGATTGAELQILRGGGYAENGATILHKHKGTHVDAATTAVRGAVRLEDAPLDAANPKVINAERILLQGSADGSQVVEGYRPGIIVPRDYQHPGAPLLHGPFHAIWYIAEKTHLQSWHVVLADGGSAAPGTQYSFRLYSGTADDVKNGTMAAIDVAISGAPTATNRPLVLSRTCDPVVTIDADRYLAVVCLAAPEEINGDEPGGGLSVTVHGRRKAGE